MRTQGWQMAVAIGLGMGGAIGLPSSTLAQTTPSNIVEDTTLGTESSQVIQNFFGLPVEAIEGGAQRGQNLFHSFSQFNVSAGRGAYFAIPNDVVRNVLTRVTGGSRSDILGTLGTFRPSDGTVRVPGVNLFLVNPNGIVFGENASLDVGGSFFATTANAVQLGDAGLFSASQPVSSNLLNVNPSAFLFNAIAAQNLSEVVVRSQVGQTVLGRTTNGLQVLNGNNLVLLGGNVAIDGGQLNAWEGRVELGGLAKPGIVGLNDNWSLRFPDGVARSDISLANQSSIDVRAANGGNISIYAHNLDISGSSEMLAGIFRGLGTQGSQAGDITLDATGYINVSGRFDSLFNPGRPSLIANRVNPEAVGNGGNIIIKTGSLSLSGAQISTSTFGRGNAGAILINANRSVVLENSGILSTVDFGGIGEGGNINITSESFVMTGFSQLLSIVRGSFAGNPIGQGNAGNINLDIQGSATISGQLFQNSDGSFTPSGGLASSIDQGASGRAGNITVKAGDLTLTNFAQIRSALDPETTGKAGNIDIQVGSLSISNTAQIESSTSGEGDAGNISLQAHDSIFVDGTVTLLPTGGSAIFSNVGAGARGNGGSIKIETGSLILVKGAQIISRTRGASNDQSGGQGNAGNISINVRDAVTLDGATSGIFADIGSGAIGKGGNVNIQARSLLLNDGASIDSSTSGQGEAGNISIALRDALRSNNGSITTRSDQFPSGNITVNARSIFLRGDSDITTNSDAGNGGNITLTAKTIVALNDSDILTFAQQGKGGNITFNTPAFFGQNYRPGSPAPFDGNNRVDINASGTVSGIITLPDVSFLQNGLIEFPQTFTDTTQLLANSCIVRSNKQNGKFFITGSGGLPLRPGDAPLSPFPTGEVRGVAEGQGEQGRQGEQGESYVIQNPTSGTQQVPDRPWKIGDPIVEPDGVYQLANGDLVMSRECK